MKQIDSKIIEKIKQTRGFFLTEGLIQPNTVGAEVGVAEGNVSWYLMKYGNVAKIHLIDPWTVTTKEQITGDYFARFEDQIVEKYNTVLDRFKSEIDKGSIIIHKTTGVEAAKQIPDESLDWVFIDDDHTYEATYENFMAFIPKVKPGGLIFGDDYYKQDVMWFKVNEAVADVRKIHELEDVGLFENRVITFRKPEV